MPHGTDGIGRLNRPDLTDLLTQTLKTGKSLGSQTLFSKMVTAAAQQLQENSVKQVELSRATHPVVTIPPPSTESGSANNFRGILEIVLDHEGSGYVKLDGGREASKRGILQSTAREYGYKGDIRNLSRADAEAIYQKIWEKSGAADLPYPLSLIHFDTYVNSPAAARKMLRASGGNTDTYLEMRAERYQRLAELKPQRYARYLNGWMSRVGHLKEISDMSAIAQNQTVQPPTKTA
ncbi:MAG: hypothetical protein HGA78_00675 [Nitrospirales bacterium]|nr:hypothetical protein [Nitrospirales bacterium]